MSFCPGWHFCGLLSRRLLSGGRSLPVHHCKQQWVHRTAHSMIGYRNGSVVSVCLSFRLSVTLITVVKRYILWSYRKIPKQVNRKCTTMTYITFHPLHQDLKLGTPHIQNFQTSTKNSYRTSCGVHYAYVTHLQQTTWHCFYRAMLRRARLCHSMSSVCDVEAWFSHRLEYPENNFTTE